MTKASSWAKHRRRENRTNQFRPEQLVIYKQLRATNRNSELLMEYSVTYTNEQDQERTAIGDIVDLTKKVFYRLNGAIHNSNKSEEKDWEQKVYLEKLGWKVVDIET